MSFDKRTKRERLFLEILRKHGSLTNTELRKIASEHPIFKSMSESATEKAVDRFIKTAEFTGIISHQDGRIQMSGSSPPGKTVQPLAGQFVLHADGFITSRAGLRCRHCMNMIDLTQVKIWRLFHSDTLLRMLHVHHFFWVTCPKCDVKARYDMNEDVKPIFPDDLRPS